MVFILAFVVPIVLLLLILFGTVLLNRRYDKWYWAWGNVAAFSPVAFFILIFGVTFSLIPAAFGGYGEEFQTKPQNSDLVALNLKTEQQTIGSVAGAFTFISGTVTSDGVRKLNYIQDVTGDGGFQAKSVDADTAIIHETTGKPHIAVSETV